jgi:hypothetical protein
VLPGKDETESYNAASRACATVGVSALHAVLILLNMYWVDAGRCHSRHNIAVIESRGHYDRRWSWRCNQSLHRARARLVRPGTVRIHPHSHRNVMAIRRCQRSLFVSSARNLIKIHTLRTTQHSLHQPHIRQVPICRPSPVILIPTHAQHHVVPSGHHPHDGPGDRASDRGRHSGEMRTADPAHSKRHADPSMADWSTARSVLT